MLSINKKTKIGIIGLGYVGLPLAIELSKKFNTTGFDIDEGRISDLLNGKDATLEISKKILKETYLKFTNDVNDISTCDIYIITVPTPVDKNNNPNFSPLESATKTVSQVLSKKNIVIYESTVYPGATEEKCVPILEKTSGLKYNHDFFCGYSPERINPGDNEHTLKNITKVVAGSNELCTDIICELYDSIITAGTHKVSSIAIAEAAKVIENVQRDVNIALINELAMIFNKLNLDTKEILDAAGTKWNFMPFQPGLVGGHCIGVDPYYLTHRAVEIGYNPEIILAGRRINDGMSKYISDRTINQLTNNDINPIGAKIAIFGLTFKENCPDMRNTKVINIIDSLLKNNCDVLVTDPYANKFEAKEKYGIDLISKDNIKKVDAVILALAHKEYKKITLSQWENMFNGNGIIIDVKSFFDKDYFLNSKISHWRL